MSSMNDYTNNPMAGFSQTYRPLPPFAMTQPEAIPSWMPAPVQRTAPYAAVPQPAAVQATLPTYGIGGTYGPDNIDPLSGGSGLPVGDAGNWWDGAFSTRDKQGWGGFALSGAQALGSLYMGMKQYNQAKEQLAFQKESFNKQYAANQSLTNSRLEDRQARRVQENPNATGVAEYMAKWGVK